MQVLSGPLSFSLWELGLTERAQETAETLASMFVMNDKVLFSWPRSYMGFARTMKLWQAKVLACK